MMCVIVLKFHIQNWHWTKDKPRERCVLSKENLDIGISLETSLIDSLCVCLLFIEECQEAHYALQ